MTTKIWFNRWFSTAFHLIELIKNNPDNEKFIIYGTNPSLDTVYLQVCDYIEQEPVLNTKEYIEYCLHFCHKHKIDVFIPYYRAVEISAFIQEFKAIGTKVLVAENNSMMDVISDKGKLFESCKQTKFAELPKYEVVNNAKDFKKAYEWLIKEGHKVCFKPVNGVGGIGFRVISSEDTSIHSLLHTTENRLTFEHVYKALSQQNTFEDIMIMELLEQEEYSIDCLSYGGSLIAAVPRKKAHGRLRILENNPELIEIAEKFNEHYKLPYIYNIQVKLNQDKPKLLEVNTRMSGGLYFSCLSGINFPYLAIKLLLTEEKMDRIYPNFNVCATYIETPITIHK